MFCLNLKSEFSILQIKKAINITENFDKINCKNKIMNEVAVNKAEVQEL
uniref:CSON005861 protein n=1 Tax=Culicoides sonorensis TaxID=179676 RepID=A0A336MRH0_CULSO